MKRLTLHLAFALLTFAAGNALAALWAAPKLTEGEIEVCLTNLRRCADQDLLRRLDAINQEYTERCLVYPTDWEEYKEKRTSGWITRCYGEWEEARRVAVKGK